MKWSGLLTRDAGNEQLDHGIAFHFAKRKFKFKRSIGKLS